MAAPTQAQLSDALRVSYAEGEFHKAEREFCPAFEDIEDLKEYTAIGKHKSFPVFFNSPKNFTVGAQSLQTGTTGIRSQKNATETPVEMLGWLLISEMILNIGKDAQSTTLGRAELKQQMKDLLLDVNQGIQRYAITGHATGALGIVKDAVVASTTVYLDEPYFVRALMVGDVIDIYTLDSGGAATETSKTITAVNNDLRTITLDAAVTCDAGEYIYRTGTYGVTLNGYQGGIDDGTWQTTIHGLSRTTYPLLKAQVKDITSGGLPSDLTENDIIVLLQKMRDIGGIPTKCVSGDGFAQAYLGITNPDRRYNVASGKTHGYRLGYKESDLQIMTPSNGEIPFKADPNCDARTAYFFSPENMRILRARKMGWMQNTGNMLLPVPISGGYSTDHIAMICGQHNLVFLEPWRTGVLRGFKDQFAAGDTL